MCLSESVCLSVCVCVCVCLCNVTKLTIIVTTSSSRNGIRWTYSKRTSFAGELDYHRSFVRPISSTTDGHLVWIRRIKCEQNWKSVAFALAYDQLFIRIIVSTFLCVQFIDIVSIQSEFLNVKCKERNSVCIMCVCVLGLKKHFF